MGIGRREFLGLFGSVIAASITGQSKAIALVDDYYVNRRLGIAFQKPPGWVFADVKQMGDMKSGQILDLDDLERSREIVDAVELPILTISKEALSTDAGNFTPGVTVYLDRISSGEASKPSAPETLLKQLMFDVISNAGILKDFDVLNYPENITVCGSDGAEYEASFLFEHENMTPTPVRMKTMTIDQGTAFYTIRMYDSPISGGEMAFDFADFVQSIRLV